MTTDANKAIILTRKELYERVWTTAMRHLGPELGVSDVGLRKICRRFAIPTPPVGYWAKKEHGKAPRRPKLPKYDGTELEGINFYPGREKAKRIVEIDENVKREKMPENKIHVAEELDTPHHLVEKTLQSLKSAKAADSGLVEPRAKRTLNIKVAPANVDRAMRIMDSLIKALENRRIYVKLTANDHGYGTTVTVSNETIQFILGERIQREEREPTATEKYDAERWPALYGHEHYYQNVPSGRLYLKIVTGSSYVRKRSYVDNERLQLENQLNAFVAGIHKTAEEIKQERKRTEELRVQREAEEKQRRQFEAKRQHKLKEISEEEAKLEKLLSETAAWQKSHAIRQFINAFREAAISKNELGEEQERMISWAIAQADRLDPLVQSPPSVLDEKAKWERPSYYW